MSPASVRWGHDGDDSLRTLYGTEARPALVERYAIGRLAFEFVGGQLRAIRHDGIEMLRGIHYLLRDRDWGTLVPAIRNFEAVRADDALRISYAAEARDPDGGRLTWMARIVARDRSLEFAVEAAAIDDVTVNRLGFCVLHPAGLAGAPLDVTHGDGSIEASCFPETIAPWQPFTDIAALTHRSQGLTVDCRFDGDGFEMEDQRNWSDASYKTYVRPLDRPWPYVVPAATIDRQAVRLTISGTAPRRPASGDDVIEIVIGAPIGTAPRIGLALTPEEAGATLERRDMLVDSGVQDLLLGFDVHAGAGRTEMHAIARAVHGLPQRLTLECVIAASGDIDAELGDVAALVAETGLRLGAIAVYPAPDLRSTPPGSAWPACPPLAEVYAAARRAFPTLLLGGGMYGYFTELNRKRPPLELLDFVSHATCPIVHAADDPSVMQSLEAIPPILRSARAIVGETPYRIGPITIGMRQNPYGSRTMPNPGRDRVPMTGFDPRQDGRFAAAWTIGYAAAAEDAALDTVTFGALTGPRGLIGDHGPRPVFAAVQALAGLAGRDRRACRSSAPDKVAAVAAGDAMIVANLTAHRQAIRAGGIGMELAPFVVATVRRGNH